MKSAIHTTKLAGPKDGRLKAGTDSAKFATDSILARIQKLPEPFQKDIQKTMFRGLRRARIRTQ